MIVTAPSTQIVGQSLILECSVTTVRGITSRIDIEWSIGNVMLQRIEGVDTTSTASDTVLYQNIYNISEVSTFDDGRVYQCKVIINTIPQIMATDSVALNVTGKHSVIIRTFKRFQSSYYPIVPDPTIVVLPSGPIQGAMVGSPQDIQCIVNAVSGVELSSVMISWMEPGGESITSDSRVTISPTISSGNNYTSSLQFNYLMEGDEGTYTCKVMILETNASHLIELQNLIGKQSIRTLIEHLQSTYAHI